jgi:oxalate---CoA ligase
MLSIHPFDNSNMSGHLSIHDTLKAQAQRTPEGIAIAALGRKPLTYSRLLEQIDVVVETLNAVGLGRSDRVALVLPNGPAMAVSFLGVAAEAICAPLNPAYKAGEFEFYLSDLKASALIVGCGTDSPAITVAQKLSVPIIELTLDPQDTAGVFSLRPQQPVTSARRGHGSAEAADVSLMLHTSGTTSRPKLVALTHTNLLTSANNVVASLLLTERDRCFNMMPLFHIHGLVGALLSSLMTGASVACAPGFDPEQLSSWWEDRRPTWYTAVPALHQAILSYKQTNCPDLQTSSLRLIRSCSAPLPLSLMRELQEVFQVPVIESYGMTEAAHQIASNPLPPRERKVGSVGLPVGTDVCVVDQQGNSMPVGQCGEIAVRGPNVIRGYANNPAANATSFSSGWLRTGDLGYLDQDGYLFITGRLKEIINRGGEKISPYEVETVLMAHPAIAESAVFPLAHPNLGEEVAAAVVAEENASLAESEIQRFAAAKLADFKVPSRIAIVNRIPRGPTGKVQRLALAEQLGLTNRKALPEPEKMRPEPEDDNVLLRTPAEIKLAEIWGKVLGIDKVGLRDNFFELGGHSLLAIKLISELSKQFQIDVPVRLLFEAPTIAQLADRIEYQNNQPDLSNKGKSTYSHLVELHGGPTQKRIFCFPYLCGMRGDFAHFMRLARYLGSDYSFYGLQTKAAASDTPPHATIEELAANYVREIEDLEPNGPYYLLGDCAGAPEAYETARQLWARGKRVGLLMLLDARGPYLPDRYWRIGSFSILDLDRMRSRVLSSRLWMRCAHLAAAISRHLKESKKLPKGKRWGYLTAKTLERIRTHFRLSQEHTSGPSEEPETSLSASEQQLLEHISLVRRHYRSKWPSNYGGRLAVIVNKQSYGFDRSFGWAGMAVGGVETYAIRGDHISYMLEYAPLVADQLRACLEKAL